MQPPLPKVLGMMRPVDPRSRHPKWLQVADQIRALIASHRVEPGDYLPSYDDLAFSAGVSVPTVRRAIESLVLEELIVTEQGVRAQIAEPRERTVENLNPGDKVIYRPATADEQRRCDVAAGANVVEVTSLDGTVRVFAPRAVEFVVDAGDTEIAGPLSVVLAQVTLRSLSCRVVHCASVKERSIWSCGCPVAKSGLEHHNAPERFRMQDAFGRLKVPSQ